MATKIQLILFQKSIMCASDELVTIRILLICFVLLQPDPSPEPVSDESKNKDHEWENSVNEEKLALLALKTAADYLQDYLA